MPPQETHPGELPLASKQSETSPSHTYQPNARGTGSPLLAEAWEPGWEGRGQVALGGQCSPLDRACSDSVSLPLPVSMSLTSSMELARARGLTRLQFPRSTPSMSTQRLQGQMTAGRG